MKYINLSIQDRQDILRHVQSETGKDLQIIEKDWWVTAVLRALFALPYAQHISFKGGTSLSKCWNITQRMSEDVDIAIDREFLGFGGPLTRTQISDRLRRAACSFVREKLQFDYQTLLPQTLSILPPAAVRDAWKKDYQAMQESMIYEESPSFDELLEKLSALNQQINARRY